MINIKLNFVLKTTEIAILLKEIAKSIVTEKI